MTGALVGGVPMATARAATPKGTADSIARWDPRIVEYVKFVENERGITFEHPIPVDFLSDKKFVKRIQGDDHESTKAQRTAAEHYAGQLRALGLVEGDVDLIGANKDLDAASITGFYSDRTKRMVIRGTDISDVVTRVTVVHELTHALQDQRYGLHELDGKVRDSGEDFALTALIEGDASYVEEAYYFSLTPAEQDEYDNWDPAEHGAPAAPDDSTGADVPPVLDVLQSAPYVFGVRFVAYVDVVEGSADYAFSHRPLSEEQIIDPVSYQLRDAPAKVRAPAILTGEKEVADGLPDAFGAYSLYVLLASRIDPTVALEAAEGWGGDSYRALRNRSGKECVRLAVVGDTPTDSDEIGSAIDRWAATMPRGAVGVSHDNTRTIFTACESTATAPTQETFDAAVSTLAVRNEVLVELARSHRPKDARCMADLAATDPVLGPLFDQSELTSADASQLKARFDSFASACGV